MNVRQIVAGALLAAACGGQPATTSDTKPTEQTAAAQLVNDTTEYPNINIKAETFQLDNGLTVVVHNDPKTPVVAVNIWYHVGSKDEKVGKTGFAHLFEHLMFQGSENYKGEFFEPLEKAGATDMNGTTNEDRTNYFQTVPTDALDLALWMESDRMGHFQGAISQELLDEQRGVVQNEKRQGQNAPYGKVREIIPPNSYPAGHPYSWTVIGSMDDLNAATLDDVKEWFAGYYGAANAVLVLAGDITVERAKQKAEKYFGDIPSGPEPNKLGPWVSPMTERREVTMYDRVPQERIYQVYNVPQYGTRTLESLRVAAMVLGSGKNSRLYKRLVYDDQLAANVYVYVGAGQLGSQIYIIADARPGVAIADVEKAIDEELERFAVEGPQLEELQRVKMSYFADLVSGLEKTGGWGGKTDLLARNQVYLGDAMAYEGVLDDVRTVGTAEVQRDAALWLNDNALVVRVLPEPKYTAATTGADRSKVPDPGKVPNLSLPPLQRAELSNGMKVVFAERHDAPVVRMAARFNVGYSHDRATKLGTAKFAMDALDEGTESMSSLELAAKLERLGASVSTFAGLDWSGVYLTTLSNTMGDSLDVFADVLKNPAFSDEEIERLRKQTLAEIAQEKARPFSTALRLVGPILYGDAHPYGVPLTGTGTEDSVNSLTRDDLVAYHQAAVRPEMMTLIVVGDTTLDALMPELEKRFSDWTVEGKAPQKSAAKPQKQDKPRIFLIDKPRAEQSLIIAGHLIGEYDPEKQLALDMMNQVLGGTFTARINMNLREDKHWSYGARSFVYETQLEQMFAAYASVQTDKTSESMVEIQKELNDIVGDRPATAEELTKTKENKTRKLPGQNESTGRVLSSISEIVNWGLPDDYWNTYVGNVQEMTLETIAASAKSNVHPDRLTWIVVGDLSKIKDKVEALGYGEVTVLDADGRPVK